MKRAERIAKIRESLPKKVFFEPCFLKKGGKLFKKIPISYEGVEHNNVLNCSPLLTKDQEFDLFRRFNFLKYLLVKDAVGFKESEDGPPACEADLEKMHSSGLTRLERLIKDILETRNIILKANTRLVVKQVSKYSDKDTFDGDEFLSGALCHVMKAIELFDHRRGFKFSTYCVNILKKELWRDMKKKREEEARSNYSDTLDPESSYVALDEANEAYNRQILERIFGMMKDLDRFKMRIAILKGMFGIGQKQTLLREVGEEFGMTRERIRQLKEQSLRHARTLVAQNNLAYDPLI